MSHPLLPRRSSKHHPARQIPRHPAREPASRAAQCPSRKVAGIPKLVGPREGDRVGDAQRHGDDDQRQPDELEADDGDDGEQHPQHRRRIQAYPEEARVGCVDGSLALLGRGLKDPVARARLWVGLVPPAQAHQTAPGDVFDVVEVGGEKEDDDDEDQDAVGVLTRGLRGGLETYKLEENQRPNR